MAQKTKTATKEADASKDALLKEKEDIESLMSHLEEEYRKASVSEKHYNELKEKYEKRLEEIEGRVEPAEVEKDVEKSPKTYFPASSAMASPR